MSYDIYIGNAEVETELDDGEYRARMVVPSVELPDAPAFPFDDLSQRRNGRHPGYTQWSTFCEQTGLTDFFMDEGNGIMREHPGCFALDASHLRRVRMAREQWEREHPAAVPGFDFAPRMMHESADDGVRGRDGVLARLLWLEWWMTWALEHCERPAIANG